MNADSQDRGRARAVATYQASRFSQICQVYAPMYRQLTLPGISARLEVTGRGGARIAYGDVRAGLARVPGDTTTAAAASC